jgi:hypothetical protein
MSTIDYVRFDAEVKAARRALDMLFESNVEFYRTGMEEGHGVPDAKFILDGLHGDLDTQLVEDTEWADRVLPQWAEEFYSQAPKEGAA